ncbi:RHS repeat domain-containing protein, partial [Dyella sp.]|uniref:RHS repeat protein n=1 Tax=Dyella sp. TaxID=1869338 RepID=UPI003F7E3386
MIARKGRLFGRCVVVLASVLMAAQVLAQSSTVTPETEYKKLIKVNEDIQPLGANPFGEQIGLYDGSLSFEQTDVSAAGNGPTLTLSRKYQMRQQMEGYNLLDNAFGDWDIDLPRITTITPNQYDVSSWVVNGGTSPSTAICTQFTTPPSVSLPKGDGGSPWDIYQWWHGYQLVIPGQGSQDLLKRSSANTLSPTISGKTFGIVTKQNWMITCLAQAENDATREAFQAYAPDGTVYTFNHLAYRWTPSISRAPGNVLNRRTASMLVTRIQDRFGNYLTYTYDASDRLIGISASDGRSLTVGYTDGTPLIRTLTLNASDATDRVWHYNYAVKTGDWTGATELDSVQLPDGSAWHFAMQDLTNNAWIDTADASSTCNAIATPVNLNSTYTGTITHPSGLVGTFTVKPVKRGRSHVWRECWSGSNGSTTPTAPNTYAELPNAWYSMAITQRSYSGAGITGETWYYSYSPSNESWTQDACTAAGTCPTTVWTDQTDPSGDVTRSTFSNVYDGTESQLLRTDYYDGAAQGTPLRSEVNTYAAATGGPWPTSYGDSLQDNVNWQQVDQQSPLAMRETVQDSDTYTWQAETFNAYAQVTQQKRFNSISGQPVLEESLGYLNDTNLWVLGLPTTVTRIKSDGTTEVESQNIYESTHDTLSQRWRFGQQLMSYTFDSAGNLHTFTDGRGNTTTLGSYKRGIPQSISYPDGTSESLAVDDFGQITSLTDQAGKTTSYAYDGVGRLTQITYPGGDSVAWAPKVFTYAYVNAAERGIGANHWRRTVSHGNAR